MKRRFRILVVEDSRTQLEGMTRVLSREGHQVRGAATGAEAIRSYRSDVPDLVILDMMLPDMDGIDVLRVLKAREGEFVPVIALSAKADVDSRVKGLQYGAQDFLAKPYHDAEVLARVEVMLRIKSLQDQVREQKERLEELSVTDGLTGLANHRRFQEKLRDEFSRAQRYSEPLSLIMIDLDHFKLVNDRFGHPFGDKVLRGTADLVRKRVRDTDTAARYGGEEFAVILPKATVAGALGVADRIHKDLNEHVFREDGAGPRAAGEPEAPAAGPAAVRVTASFGVACYPARGVTSPDLLIRFADEALYGAKRERNAIQVYNSGTYRYDVSGR